VSRLRVTLALWVVVVTTIGCDQVSKRMASNLLAGTPTRTLFGDSVRFEYAENPGAFLSLGATLPGWARTALFSAGTMILLVACGIVLWRHRQPPLALAGWCLVFAGGISNLLDRLARGRVVDFVSVGVGPIRTGIFNVADMAITLGIGLVLVQSFLARQALRRG
jgi:signal peptidase II